jgi:hypothetical protein
MRSCLGEGDSNGASPGRGSPPLTKAILSLMSIQRLCDWPRLPPLVLQLRRWRAPTVMSMTLQTDLAKYGKVSATDAHVKTYEGVVDLSGFVNSRSEIAEAGFVAGKVSGIKSFTTTKSSRVQWLRRPLQRSVPSSARLVQRGVLVTAAIVLGAG